MSKEAVLHPTKINLGSGKDFRDDYLNIDVDRTWTPDAVIDLSEDLNLSTGHLLQTDRFGVVLLKEESFTRIIANDVLEHVPNLVKLMTNCLALLEIDGVFEVSVPYDLSFGSWQDPTHVRAFNERSWLYYTDWFWYLGWSKSRFVLDDIKFTLSEIGTDLKRKGIPDGEVVRTPRAIDSMRVKLRKISLTPDDKKKWHHFRESKIEAARARTTIQQSLGSTNLQAFPHQFQAHKDAHCIWVVCPPNYSHHKAFDEVAISLQHAFEELGGSAPIIRSHDNLNGRSPIILGSHLLGQKERKSIPRDSIIVNLEQYSPDSRWFDESYLDLIRSHALLDFSRKNISALKSRGIKDIGLLELGYSSRLQRIPRETPKDIDVLFYGSMNERRARILGELRSRGVHVKHLFDVYGPERDDHISRSKIVLNIHYYSASIFEAVRVSYLLNNEVCVVCEGQCDDPDIQRYRDGLEIAAYDCLVNRCLDLLGSPDRRKAIAAAGYASISKQTQAEILQTMFSF